MSEPRSALSLATNPAAINPAGASQADLEEYQKSLEAQISALEQRYAQPNWYKVAAGFLKPQLGGFAASLGSAAEAAGENLEMQRASALPIAQMRSQLAQSKILTGQNKTVADMVAEHLGSGKQLTPEFVAEVNRIAPDSPSAKALTAQLAASQKQRELVSSEQANAMQRIQLARQMGTQPNPKDLALVAASSPTETTTTTPRPAAAPSTEATDRLLRDRTALENELKRIPATPENKERRLIIQSELDKVTSKLDAGAAEAAEPPKVKAQEYLPMTVSVPQLSDVPDPERQRIIASQTDQRAKDFEKTSTERYNNLKTLTAPEFTSSANAAAKTALSLMEDHPEMAQKVLNMVRSSGPLAAAMAHGVSAQFNSTAGSFGGAVQFPVEAFVEAKLTPKEQEYADALLNSLATMKAYSLKLGGVTPTALVNHPAGMALTQQINFDRNQTPSALYNSVKHFQFNTDFLRDYNAALEKEFSRVNPASLTRLTDAFNSPALQKLSDAYSNVHHTYDRAYSKRRFSQKD